MTTILVTGATGTIGSRLVSALADKQGISVRAAVRDPAKAMSLAKGNVALVPFDWAKPSTVAAALSGADKAFLLTPLTDDQVELGKRFIDAARAAGVKHLVKLSTLGAEQEPGILLGRWHRDVERHAEASGIPTTSIRPNAFMSNFIHYTRPDEAGTLYMPLGQGAASFVDPRDIADVVAAVLVGKGHAGKTYALTGPEALTIGQVAEQIAKVSGRAIRYVDVPAEAARAAMLGMGAPAWMVDGMLELYAIMKAGYTAATLSTVADVTGRAPRTFAEFARDHASAWQA